MNARTQHTYKPMVHKFAYSLHPHNDNVRIIYLWNVLSIVQKNYNEDDDSSGNKNALHCCLLVGCFRCSFLLTFKLYSLVSNGLFVGSIVSETETNHVIFCYNDRRSWWTDQAFSNQTFAALSWPIHETAINIDRGVIPYLFFNLLTSCWNMLRSL